MVQSLAGGAHNWDKWFEYANDDRVTYEQVKIFICGDNLFCERDGVKTALVDWRPLPRFNQKENSKQTGWPFEGGVNEKQYLDAFAFVNENR